MEIEFACPSVSLAATGAIGTNKAGVCVPLHYHCAAISIPAKLFIQHHSFSLLHGIGVYMPLFSPHIYQSCCHKHGWSMRLANTFVPPNQVTYSTPRVFHNLPLATKPLIIHFWW